MRKTPHLFLTIAILSLLATACSSNGDTDHASTDSLSDERQVDGSPDSTDHDIGEDMSEATDDPTSEATEDPSASCQGNIVLTVTGRVVDSRGEAIAEAKAQLCIHLANSDMLRCIRAVTTDAQGEFEVRVPEDSSCMESASIRVYKLDTNRATKYCEIPMTPARGVLNISDPITLYATQPATTLPPEGDTAQVRTVVFADGLEIDVLPSSFYGTTGTYEQLAMRSVDPSEADLCFLDSPSDILHLYAFSPEADIEGANYALRMPNHSGLAAGSTVTLFVLGGLYCSLPDGENLAEAEWREVGEAIVSSDGSTIEAPAGLPCFTWLGYR